VRTDIGRERQRAVEGWGVADGWATGLPGVAAGPDGASRRTAHLTIAFDHDVVDGAPAARLTSRLLQLLASGETARP
jgi:pyruvate/2-oxoglutarate dehydrogenase complex dihydrolipoamide acyltransferase (E2) component